MWRTLDGYTVSLPRFRTRRLARRLSDPRRRALVRAFRVLIGRARRVGERTAPGALAHPRLEARLGRARLELVTRALAPRRLELLYIRRTVW